MANTNHCVRKIIVSESSYYLNLSFQHLYFFNLLVGRKFKDQHFQKKIIQAFS